MEAVEDLPLRIVVDGDRHDVKVYRHTVFPSGPSGPCVEFLGGRK